MPSILRWLKFSYRSPSDSVLFHNVQLSTRMFTLMWRNDENINASTTTRKDLYFFMLAVTHFCMATVCVYVSCTCAFVYL